MAIKDIPPPIPTSKADALERAARWLNLAVKTETEGKPASMVNKALERAIDFEALAATLN